jgi:ATP-dependent helicase/nuclease subunit B
MGLAPTKVFTISSDQPFLDVLAAAILEGFPFDAGAAKEAIPLPLWTILVPTRRAARTLQDKLLRLSQRQGLLLPAIRPIGDIDEDLLVIAEDAVDLPDAISPIGRHFALMALIDAWVAENAHLRLAAEITRSPRQAQSLALSLGDLMDSLETEDIALDRLAEAYDFDLAIHREAILGLLDLICKRLPDLYLRENLVGSAARRSHVIRREARRLHEHLPAGPVIAAGSTGTIPATRELLRAISHLDAGAVILPGLDLTMDAESWDHITPQHPQFALKGLLTALEVPRDDVGRLGPAEGARAWLAGEAMRPTETADQWHQVLKLQQEAVMAAMAEVRLVEAADKTEEAAAIALIIRQALVDPAAEIALVTADRDLARRVKSALLRWSIASDDSAGEPLVRFPAASLIDLLLEAALSNFSAPALAALLTHPLARFGLERDAFRQAAQNLDIALLRAPVIDPGLDGLLASLDVVRRDAGNRSYHHPALRRFDDAAWAVMRDLCVRLRSRLAPLAAKPAAALAEVIDTLITVAEATAGDELWSGEEAAALVLLFEDFRREAYRFGACSLERAAGVVQNFLRSTPLRRPASQTTRVAILGLLEARLVGPQTVIMGGLNEGSWPRQSDPGPWLNRPMRALFGMQQPERHIGQMAHDFVQAFGARRVYLTWSRRNGMDPAIASRWLLRLKTVVEAAGVAWPATSGEGFVALARQLDQPAAVVPLGKPLPRPALLLRPSRLSVTQIETLIRDPYAIYAEKILELRPLPGLTGSASPDKRGSLYHQILAEFFASQPLRLTATALDDLLTIGHRHFHGYRNNPEVTSFWWPRFERLAAWIVATEMGLTGDVAKRVTEVIGDLEIPLAGQTFHLTCRTDRIDILADGSARIIDYKTGLPPSVKAVEAGFSPQLTLEAAMLARGAFADLQRHATRDLTYVRISGGVPAGEILPLTIDVMATAEKHLAALTALLVQYAQETQPYIPRYAVQSEDALLAYDHLSRYREWLLSGGAT